MTWGEFKRQVESQDVKDQDEIEWIDVASFPLEIEVRGADRDALDQRKVAIT